MSSTYTRFNKRGRRWPKIKEERTLAQQIRLSFLLPELAPYSASTASGFESLGVGDKVSLVLGENRNPDWLPTYLKNVSSRLDRGVQHPSDAPGLVHLRDTVTQGDVFLMGDPPKKPYFQIICDAPRAGTEQTCHAMADFSTNLTVEYDFSRRHLPQWRGIHNLLVRELGRFAAAAGQPIKGE